MEEVLTETQNLDRRPEQTIEELKKENQELKLCLATLVKLPMANNALRREEVAAAVNAVEGT